MGPAALPEPAPLPEGWEVAPSKPEIAFNVIGGHNWGTSMLVARDGAGYTTALWDGSGGSKISNFELKVHGGDLYAPRRNLKSRPSRVLIRYPANHSELLNKDDWPIFAGEGPRQAPKVAGPKVAEPPQPMPAFVHTRCAAELARAPISWTPISVELVMERHARSAPGMLYGLEFPWSEQMLVDMGPEWLTQAFHAAGTIPKDNRVTKIVPENKVKVTTGNNGGKFLFEVEYAKEDPELQTQLFAKVPFALEGKTRSDRLSSSVYKQPHELYELNTYRLMESALPVRIPRFYFGDISNETSNWILITERVPFASAENFDFTGPSPDGPRGPLGAWLVEGPYDKCMDWMLRGEASEYYTLLVRTGAKLAGMHRAGKLGNAEAISGNFEDWSGRSEDSWGMGPGATGEVPKTAKAKIDVAITFISDTGKVLFPAYVTTPAFKSKLKTVLMTQNAYKAELTYWRHSDPDFIAFTHQNMNVDNAYFWRDADGKLDLGVFDWSNLGSRSLGYKLWWWLYCGEYEQLTANIDSYIDTLVSSYHEHGGPLLDKAEVRKQFIVTAIEQMQGLCAAVPQIMRMCPKKEWATIQDRYDSRVGENVDGKSTLRLYLQVMCTIMRIIEEWDGAGVLESVIEDFHCGKMGKERKSPAVVLAD